MSRRYFPILLAGLIAACGGSDDNDQWEPIPDDPACALQELTFQPTAAEAKRRLQTDRWLLCSGAEVVEGAAGIQFTQGQQWHFLKKQAEGGALTVLHEAMGPMYEVQSEDGVVVVTLTWTDGHKTRVFPVFDADPNRLRLDFGKPGRTTTAWYKKVR